MDFTVENDIKVNYLNLKHSFRFYRAECWLLPISWKTITCFVGVFLFNEISPGSVNVHSFDMEIRKRFYANMGLVIRLKI